MGDPLSVAASILAILDAGGIVGKGLRKLVTLKRAPDILLGLNNEIADLHCVVQTVNEVLQQHRAIEGSSVGRVSQSLDNIKQTLATFESVVTYELTVVAGSDNHLRLDKSSWLLAEPKVERLKNQIQVDKADLCLAWCLLTHSISLQDALQAHELRTSVDGLQTLLLQTRDTIFRQLQVIENSCNAASARQRQQEISLRQITQHSGYSDRADHSVAGRVQFIQGLVQDIKNRHTDQEHSLRNIERSLRQYHEVDGVRCSQSNSAMQNLISCHHSQLATIRSIEQELSRLDPDTSLRVPRIISREPETMNRSVVANDTAGQRAVTIHASKRLPSSLIASLNVTQTFCASSCGCTCHKKRRFMSPTSLNALLGSLFMGYKASPGFAQKCTSADCQHRTKQFTYTYAFPQWLIRRVVFISMMYSRYRGPELCLRVMRVRPHATTIFADFSFSSPTNDLVFHKLKHALNNGGASVLDINIAGRTLLHIALLYENFACANLLIRAGADMTYEDVWGGSALSAALDLLIDPHQLRTQDESAFIREQFCDQSRLEMLELTDLQRSYFGISGVHYDAALSSTQRCAIDRTDRTGRTMLSWAARGGDFDQISRLLTFGADPGNSDARGMNSLHFATFSASIRCMRLLIDAKVDLEAKTEIGRTALMYSAQKDSGTITTLLESGVDLETPDSYGMRPLHFAAKANCGQNVLYLLQAGADVNARTPQGNSALEIAVHFNSHKALKSILAASRLEPQVSDCAEMSVVGLAARRGDEQTLQILHSGVLGGADVRLSDEQRIDAFKAAEWRRGENDAWSESTSELRDIDPAAWFRNFEALVQAIANRQHQFAKGVAGLDSSQSNSMPGGVTSENATAEGSEDTDSWEDALELQDTNNG